MRSFCALVLLLLCSLQHYAQADRQPIPGTLIVQLFPNYSLQSFQNQLKNNSRQPALCHVEKILSVKQHIHQLQFDSALNPFDIKAWVSRLRGVKAVQFDYELEQRSTPDDPVYPEQWSMEKIGLADAWNITTGGLSANGDTIVIAITDAGFNTEHLDINSNLWINRAEIPDDGIDNDLNGYIDDDQGWNFRANSNRHPTSPHGHKVAGIAGARGNNGFGATGVNWQIKLMLFTSTKVSDLILAYEYMIDQRKQYNESNGQSGAFVVATNLSLGLSRTFCEDYPMWGEMYDQLGSVGILAGVAAANEDYDVEVFGDMPLICKSDFILSVTNTTIDDVKVRKSAFGNKSVDMGAPGEGTVTIDLFEERGVFSGTSAAAPHITGAIALLYSLPCSSFATEALQQPAQTALAVRQALLDGTDPLLNLQEKTATGGRLNVHNSLKLLGQNCTTGIGELDLLGIYPNPSTGIITLDLQTPDFEEYELIVYNMLGQYVYREKFSPLQFAQRKKNLRSQHISCRHVPGLHHRWKAAGK